MNTDLEAQIRSIADEAFTQTSPVDVDRFRDASSRAGQPTSSEEYVMLSPDIQPSLQVPRRTRMVTIAASLIVVVAGIVALTLWRGGSDESEPLDQSTPSSAVDTAALASIGERLMIAFDTADPDTVAALVADDAEPISMFGASSKSELLALFGWIEASDWRFELRGCEGRVPDQTRCTVLQSNAWATAAGAGPAEGTLFVTIDDGEVVALRYRFDNAFTQYFVDFQQFVRETDPEAAEQMWATESDGRTVWPVLDDRSYDLFERYSAQYIESLTE